MLSYETCKKLKETGFPQTSFMIYSSTSLFNPKIKLTEVLHEYDICCPSFEEIWAELPESIREYKKQLTSLYIQYSADYGGDLEYVEIKDNNITEAAADLWLLLKKEELI
jgi:hypothetical protein